MALMDQILVTIQMVLNLQMEQTAPMVLTDQTAQMAPRMVLMVLIAPTAVTLWMVQSLQMVLTLVMAQLNGMAHKLFLRIIPIILIILLIVAAVRPLNNNWTKVS